MKYTKMQKGSVKINVEPDRITRFLAEGYTIQQKEPSILKKRPYKVSAQIDVIKNKPNHSIEINSPEDLVVDAEDDLNKLEE